jgi:hypothetical protein
MLIRTTTDGTHECMTQEHHALLSGVLAGAWLPTRLPALLVQAIGLHDNPWRPVDAEPTFDPEAGLPHDFLGYPKAEKLDFYRRGIDQLEEVHPYVAYVVSRHYTTFAGTKDAEALTEPEAERRERLAERIRRPLLDEADVALEWVKYFDILSLYICLDGPRATEDSVPPWLEDPTDWAEAPDGTELEFEWRDDRTLAIEPWPFTSKAMDYCLHFRRLDGRTDDAEAFREQWADAPMDVRPVEFVR